MMLTSLYEWFVGLGPIQQALIATLFTWLMTALGAGAVFSFKSINRKLLDSQYKSLLHVDGHVCGFSMIRKSLRCLDLETGTLQWQWRSKITAGSTIAVDGRCLVLGEKGRLAAVKLTPEGVEEIAMTARPILQGPILAYPALHNGLLYLRNDDELLCVDLRR